VPQYSDYQKLRTAEEPDRERLKLWRIRPIDMMVEKLAQQTRERERIRREAKPKWS
jgi:hypothetical protein